MWIRWVIWVRKKWKVAGYGLKSLKTTENYWKPLKLKLTQAILNEFWADLNQSFPPCYVLCVDTQSLLLFINGEFMHVSERDVPDQKVIEN
jgi:hypothetical protein